MATLAQLQTAVRDKLGLPVDDGMMTDAVLLRDINSRLHFIASQHDWHWLIDPDGTSFSTVVGQRSYTPAGALWRRTLHLYDDGRPLLLRQPQDLHTPRTGEANLRSVEYAVEGGKILLWPTPEAVRPLVHIFVKDETDLASAGDTPLLPDYYSDYLVTLAAIQGAVRMDNTKRADQLRIEAGEWLKVLQNDARKVAGSIRVRRTRPALWGGGVRWRS